MNRAELIESMTKKVEGATKKQAKEFLDAFIGTVTDTLAKGDKVVISDFGVFSIKERAARIGRNPQTGKEIKIAGKNAPVFKAYTTLKDAVK